MSTIREVAKRAGVSVSTVSHVVNETRFVSEDTRSRVLSAMAELRYKPNRLARSLRRKDKRTQTLGLLIPDSTNPFFSEVLRGVEDACFDGGYNVILCNSDGDSEKELNYLNVLLGKQVDGIVLVSAGAREDSLELIAARHAAAVVVDREIEGVGHDSVIVDNEEGGYTATQYLLGLGHKVIGCVTGPSPLTPSAGRSQGYRKALNDAAIEASPNLLVSGDFRPQSGYQAAMQIMGQRPDTTAIFAGNDMMALGAIRALNEIGLHVPKDVSVIGFDDIALASFTTPPLTTIAQPSIEMGMLAAELLIERLQKPDLPVRRELLPTTLVVRDSCRKVQL